MKQHWNGSQPSWHDLETESRLTTLEGDVKDLRKVDRGHGRRITALEDKKKRPSWQPRDYILSASGVVIVIAALTEKIGWTHAIAALIRVAGGR